MIQKSKLSVSIVIPVYNEAACLSACLDALARQTVTPLEVIVVDNNSTDETVAVAERYSFVRLLREKRQGVVYARDRGFDAARGEVIGRIDADSLVESNWIANVQKLFREADNLTAVTGSVGYYGLSASWLLDGVDLWIRRRMARLLGHEVALQGANMALRRSAWLAVRQEVCRQGGMHEDYDLAIHLSQQGGLNKFDESLRLAVDCRRLDNGWLDFCYYAWLSPQTYAKHGLKSRRHMYPMVALIISCLPALKFMRRSYDQRQKSFSWHQVLFGSVTSVPHVNPATFVD